jgi:hypothetical protein
VCGRGSPTAKKERGGFEPESNIVQVEIELDTILLKNTERVMS